MRMILGARYRSRLSRIALASLSSTSSWVDTCILSLMLNKKMARLSPWNTYEHWEGKAELCLFSLEKLLIMEGVEYGRMQHAKRDSKKKFKWKG